MIKLVFFSDCLTFYEQARRRLQTSFYRPGGSFQNADTFINFSYFSERNRPDGEKSCGQFDCFSVF
jgi:hypothetical protein